MEPLISRLEHHKQVCKQQACELNLTHRRPETTLCCFWVDAIDKHLGDALKIAHPKWHIADLKSLTGNGCGLEIERECWEVQWQAAGFSAVTSKTYTGISC